MSICFDGKFLLTYPRPTAARVPVWPDCRRPWAGHSPVRAKLDYGTGGRFTHPPPPFPPFSRCLLHYIHTSFYHVPSRSPYLKGLTNSQTMCAKHKLFAYKCASQEYTELKKNLIKHSKISEKYWKNLKIFLKKLPNRFVICVILCYT